MMIVAPPVQPDLLGFVDRTDEQSDTDGKELDLCQRDLDIAGHHEALVQDPVEHLDQPGGASVSFDNRGHRPGILPHRVTSQVVSGHGQRDRRLAGLRTRLQPDLRSKADTNISNSYGALATASKIQTRADRTAEVV